jgi:hypothetical protein
MFVRGATAQGQYPSFLRGATSQGATVFLKKGPLPMCLYRLLRKGHFTRHEKLIRRDSVKGSMPLFFIRATVKCLYKFLQKGHKFLQRGKFTESMKNTFTTEVINGKVMTN